MYTKAYDVTSIVNLQDVLKNQTGITHTRTEGGHVYKFILFSYILLPTDYMTTYIGSRFMYTPF